MSENVYDLNALNTACDEFVAGKYILADIKIASILKIIDADEKVKNIVASTLNRFDFVTCLKQSTTENADETYTFTLPKDEKDIIAFVYSLLFRFNSKEISFYDFLNKYFKTDDALGQEFKAFANNIILPFKAAINSVYAKRHIIVDANDYQKNYYNKIMTTIRLIVSNIDSFKLKMNEKEEFTMLLNSLYIASEQADKKLVFSLMIALDYFSRFNKRTRNAYYSLEECFTRESNM